MTTETDDIRKRLAENRQALDAASWERQDEITSLFVAVLAREHCLLVGPPGTGKSWLVGAFARSFSDATYWQFLFTRQTTEDQVMAHLDVPAFVAGRHEYVLDGHAPRAHIAFADEIFKASGSTANAALEWLNERRYRGHDCPLISCFAASNEYGEDDTVAAFEDRMLLRHQVEPIKDRANKIEFLRALRDSKLPSLPHALTLAELSAAQQAAAALPVDDVVLHALAAITEQLAGAGVYVSDRRIGKAVRILQAYAWLEGDDAVDLEHCDVLRHVLWQRPEQRPAVNAAIANAAQGVISEIRKIAEEALGAFYEARDSGDRERFRRNAPSYLSATEDAARRIKEILGDNPSERMKERARGYLQELRSAFREAKEAAKELS